MWHKIQRVWFLRPSILARASWVMATRNWIELLLFNLSTSFQYVYLLSQVKNSTFWFLSVWLLQGLESDSQFITFDDSLHLDMNYSPFQLVHGRSPDYDDSFKRSVSETLFLLVSALAKMVILSILEVFRYHSRFYKSFYARMKENKQILWMPWTQAFGRLITSDSTVSCEAISAKAGASGAQPDIWNPSSEGSEIWRF